MKSSQIQRMKAYNNSSIQRSRKSAHLVLIQKLTKNGLQPKRLFLYCNLRNYQKNLLKLNHRNLLLRKNKMQRKNHPNKTINKMINKGLNKMLNQNQKKQWQKKKKKRKNQYKLQFPSEQAKNFFFTKYKCGGQLCVKCHK